MPIPVFPDVAKMPHVTRAPRTLRGVRRKINRRAYALAQEAYERFRAELEAAVAEDGWSVENIDSWLPADQRA